MTTPQCVLCGGRTAVAFQVDEIDLVDCSACGHRQANLAVDKAHVERVYDDSYFEGGGAGYEDYHSEGDLLRARGKRYGRILTRHRSPAAPGRILDIGAAAGFLMEGFTREGWAPTGLEPNDRMAASGRARGLDLRTGSAEDLLPQLQQAGEHFDAVSIIQVIAHVGDPVELVSAVCKILRPGGLVLIETWDRASVSARLFKQRWHEYSPPSVVQWFTRPELDRMMHAAACTKVAAGRYPKWITASHGRQLVEHRMGTDHVVSKAARAIPARLKVPYPGDDLFWSLYRRSA
jgi:2-polyprenyl-3-methyl-5-hydroxy-6-metoxy-1,4-benzoquinol methylase